jgi:nucleoside-diphosphate-sugar epimerase
MKVLVTGASGTIGRRAVAHLAADDVAVTAVSMPVDVCDEAVVGSVVAGCDAVVHLAALAHPSLGTPRQVFTNNVVATFTVLAQAAAHGVTRVVLASSVNAAGIAMNPHAPPPPYFPLDENLPPDVADAYSLSKQVDECTAAMAARTWGMTVVALRFPLVRPRAGLLEIVSSTDPADMMRTGWSYLTDDDAARAIVAALHAPLTGAHVVGLSAEDTLLEPPTESLLDEYAPSVPRRKCFTGRESLIDTTRARTLLGFTPAETLR